MDPVRFRPEPPLVADASVWINLVAGGRALDVLRAFAKPTIIPSIALDFYGADKISRWALLTQNCKSSRPSIRSIIPGWGRMPAQLPAAGRWECC